MGGGDTKISTQKQIQGTKLNSFMRPGLSMSYLIFKKLLSCKGWGRVSTVNKFQLEKRGSKSFERLSGGSTSFDGPTSPQPLNHTIYERSLSIPGNALV